MLPIQANLAQSRLKLQGFQSHTARDNVVLALHGWLDNCFSFRPLSNCLHSANMLAFDLPGHGDSDTIPQGMPYDFHSYLIWLHELIEALELEKVTLLGHSMGAVIASLYAGVYPEKLNSLVLIEGIGPFSVPDQESPAKMKSFIQSWTQELVPANSLFPSWDKAVRARQSAGLLTEESAKTLAERGARAVDGGVMWKHDSRLKLPSRYQFSETQILAFLSQITCPTLLIEGTQSLLPQNELMERRRQAIAKLTHMKIKGAHHLHMDTPEPVAKALELFWAV